MHVLLFNIVYETFLLSDARIFDSFALLFTLIFVMLLSDLLYFIRYFHSFSSSRSFVTDVTHTPTGEWIYFSFVRLLRDVCSILTFK